MLQSRFIERFQGTAVMALLVAGIGLFQGECAVTDDALIALSQDPQAVAAGKETYQMVCFSCHGQMLEGGTGFNLRDGEWIHGSSPTQIYTSIAKGFPEKGMVAFGEVYDESKLAEMTAYILSEQIGLRDLSYQIFHSAPTDTPLERLTSSEPTRSGVLPQNYTDETLPEVDDYAMVFEGTLLVPNEGEHFLKVGLGRGDDLKVEVDGNLPERIPAGNREFKFPVKNGAQTVRLSYLKKAESPRFEVYLEGDSLYQPLSLSARNRLLRTSYLVKAEGRPVVMRKKIEHLPPKSIAVGYPGSLNYGFSPVTNSIVGLWDGEFLNIGPNIDGRGKDASRILGEWIFRDSPGIQLLVDGKPVIGPFIKYSLGDNPRFEYGNGEQRVRVSAQPNGLDSIRFFFNVEGVRRKRVTLRLPEIPLKLESDDGAVLVGRFIVDKAKRNQFSITLSK